MEYEKGQGGFERTRVGWRVLGWDGGGQGRVLKSMEGWIGTGSMEKAREDLKEPGRGGKGQVGLRGPWKGGEGQGRVMSFMEGWGGPCRRLVRSREGWREPQRDGYG